MEHITTEKTLKQMAHIGRLVICGVSGETGSFFTQFRSNLMSISKNSVNGAGWMRRGLVAIAGAAMAFTALSAAPSQDAPVDDEVALRISSKSAPRLDDRFDIRGGPTTSAMRGGSWG